MGHKEKYNLKQQQVRRSDDDALKSHTCPRERSKGGKLNNITEKYKMSFITRM